MLYAIAHCVNVLSPLASASRYVAKAGMNMDLLSGLLTFSLVGRCYHYISAFTHP